MREAIRDTDSQRRAREIMRSNFLGLPEVEKHLRVINPEERLALAEIPESLMMAIQDANVRRDYVLVADVGLSILDIRNKAKDLFKEQDWYDSEEFARRTDETCWRLIRKTPVPGSTPGTWQGQRKLIPKTDEISSARTIVYMIILRFLATSTRSFEHVCVRTRDVGPSRSIVDVGYVGQDVLRLNYTPDNVYAPHIGVCSSRKAS